MPAPLLNIAALSRRTGVAADTLRKWEQRYGVLRPERTAGGQRRYTDDRRSARGMAPRPDQRRVADQGGGPRAGRGRDRRARRSRGAPGVAHRRRSGDGAATCRCDARSDVLRSAARAGAVGGRHTRLALGGRGVASRRAVGRPGARDLGQGPPAPGEAPRGRSGWGARHRRARRAHPASSTTSD